MAKHGENIYQRKDGRYEGRYVIGKKPSGETKFGYVYGTKYMDVQRKLVLLKANEQKKAASLPACRCTLSQWLPSWMESELMGTVKLSTYQVYRNQARHLLEGLGCFRLSELTSELLLSFVRKKEEAGLSCSTVSGIYRLLRAALSAAQREGLIVQNPCKKIRFKQQEVPTQRVLTREELKKLRNAGEEALPALVGRNTGIRLGEVCALKWSDIDWENRTLTIRRAVQRVAKLNAGNGKRTQLVIGTPKTYRSCRVVPIADFLFALLRKRFEAQPDGEYIFGHHGQPADPRTIQRQFKRLAARLGIKDVHFHTLRHSFATQLVQLGVDIRTVSDLLGHSSVKITLDFYTHSSPEMHRKAIDKLTA